MTILSYSRTRLYIGAALFSLTTFGFVIRIWVTQITNPLAGRSSFGALQLEWVYPLGFLIAAAALVRTLHLLNGDLAALKVLPEGLQVTSFFRRKTIAWDSLLGGHKVTYWTGLHRRRMFNIRYLDDGANKTMRIPLILAKRPSGGHMSLSDKVDGAREEALGRPSEAGGERIPGTGIDHDAAIARYLKAKGETAATIGTPIAGKAPTADSRDQRMPAWPLARPAFGRKGLG